MTFIDIVQIKEQIASLADTSYVVSERHPVAVLLVSIQHYS